MVTYLALLRGVNVGGKGIISMAELKQKLTDDSFKNVRTYINSGNVLFESAQTDTLKLAARITHIIEKHFTHQIDVAVFSAPEWRNVIADEPTWWGKDPHFKHNLLVFIPPHSPAGFLDAVGQLKPDIEKIKIAGRVVYQSLSWKDFSKTASSRLAGKPIYKQITIRNYNTAHKLADLLGK